MRRDIGNPVTLYNACKQWVRDEAECFAEPATLAQVWHRAVQQNENGRTFRRYVLHNYDLYLESKVKEVAYGRY